METEKRQNQQQKDAVVRKALQGQALITKSPSLLAISKDVFEEVLRKKHAQIVVSRDKQYRCNGELDFAYKAVSELIDRVPHVQSILITGKYGSGKTCLLQAIAESFRFLAQDSIKGLSEEFDKMNVLLLDDVGIQPKNEIITGLIISRYDNHQPTILASVYDAESLAEIYGRRIGDILSECYVQLELSINHRINE